MPPMPRSAPGVLKVKEEVVKPLMPIYSWSFAALVIPHRRPGPVFAVWISVGISISTRFRLLGLVSLSPTNSYRGDAALLRIWLN